MPRRPRRSSGRRGPAWQMVGGITLLSAVLLTLAFGYYLLIVTRQSHVELDRETYCPTDGPQSVTAVLIDMTDPINAVQRTDLMNEIEKLVDEVRRFGGLEIYSVGPIEEKPPRPIFRKCNPGRADEISEFFANPRMVERDWREGFRKPLEETLERTLKPAEADNSPILESIQWVTINALTPPGRTEIPRRLVVVSDMLQHTASLSFYRGIPDFDTFESSPYYQRVRAPLEEVAVDLFFVCRDTRTPIQQPALLRFWTDYFDFQGVRSLRVVQIVGCG